MQLNELEAANQTMPESTLVDLLRLVGYGVEFPGTGSKERTIYAFPLPAEEEQTDFGIGCPVLGHDCYEEPCKRKCRMSAFTWEEMREDRERNAPDLTS